MYDNHALLGFYLWQKIPIQMDFWFSNEITVQAKIVIQMDFWFLNEIAVQV